MGLGMTRRTPPTETEAPSKETEAPSKETEAPSNETEAPANEAELATRGTGPGLAPGAPVSDPVMVSDPARTNWTATTQAGSAFEDVQSSPTGAPIIDDRAPHPLPGASQYDIQLVNVPHRSERRDSGSERGLCRPHRPQPTDHPLVQQRLDKSPVRGCRHSPDSIRAIPARRQDVGTQMADQIALVIAGNDSHLHEPQSDRLPLLPHQPDPNLVLRSRAWPARRGAGGPATIHPKMGMQGQARRPVGHSQQQVLAVHMRTQHCAADQIRRGCPRYSDLRDLQRLTDERAIEAARSAAHGISLGHGTRLPRSFRDRSRDRVTRPASPTPPIVIISRS